MGQIAAARAELVAVLDTVLPGRVYPYPPDMPAPTAPAVYVCELGGDWNDEGFVAEFRVRLVADGANRAAHAQLDDLIDACRDAVRLSDTCYPGSVSYEPFDVDATTTLPGYVFTAQVVLVSNGWCQPDPPAAVPIPVTPLT